MAVKERVRVIRGGRGVPAPLRKGVYILPNLFTTGGLFAGFYSVIASLHGDFQIAALMILLAQIFDILDGRVARLTRSTSRFGIEYDSLSDLVAFGVAPGILAYRWALEPWQSWGWLAASLYVTCGALRLARFNVQYDNVEKRHFVGLPIPAAADVVASTVLLYYYFGGLGATHKHLLVLLVIYALGALMVSNVKYFSFKEVNLHRRQPFWLLVAGIFLLKLLIAEPQLMAFAASTLFAVSGPARALFVRGRWLLHGRRRSLKVVESLTLTREGQSPTDIGR
ncbi:MAG TPA: CDP-diacylglycerol--serine O-phosphatidyltransferase [Candidatus Kryptonia bacterium]|nr:CDP-diacylglycerol--serine O-phosphatidyltransferase [Candidatus Kryptonia bacterium]